MKKKITMLMLAVIAALSLTACGKFTCDICGEEKTGVSHSTTFLGEKITICDDCYKELRALGGM